MSVSTLPPTVPPTDTVAVVPDARRHPYDRRADLWEATVGRQANRVVDDHLRAGAAVAEHVLDLGAGSARALDRFARLSISPTTYLGIEREPSLVAAAVSRTWRHRDATVFHGDVETRPLPAADGPRLVLLTWVLSALRQPDRMLQLARLAAGPDGWVVAAAVTETDDRRNVLDSWIRHRWHVRPVEPLLLTRGADRLSVTLQGRAIVATIRGTRAGHGS